MLKTNPRTDWLEASQPELASGSYVDETAVLIGKVVLQRDAIVFPYCVLRADEGSPIEIGSRTNVQDGVIMHCLMNSSINIGPDCCIAHGGIIHGPVRIGAGTFVGFRATLLDATVGKNCFIGHHSLVMNVQIPDEKTVPPGKIITCQNDVETLPNINAEQREFTEEVLETNCKLLEAYANTSGVCKR